MEFSKFVTVVILSLSLFFGCAMKKDFHYIIDVPAIRVHCVSSVDQIPENKKGYVKGNEMWVISDPWEGKIFPYPDVLWHEFQHFLQIHSDGLVLNPDDMFSLSIIPTTASWSIKQ
jgi:hypothetical protein